MLTIKKLTFRKIKNKQLRNVMTIIFNSCNLYPTKINCSLSHSTFSDAYRRRLNGMYVIKYFSIVIILCADHKSKDFLIYLQAPSSVAAQNKTFFTSSSHVRKIAEKKDRVGSKC